MSAQVARARKAQADAAAWVEDRRSTTPAIDAGFEVFERHRRVAGGLLASALAYRLFLWLLPVALMASVTLGFLQDYGDPDAAASQLGMSAYVRSVVSDASTQAHQSKWWLLVVALVAMWSAAGGGTKALVALHQLAWDEPVHSQKTGWRALAGFLAFTVAASVTALITRTVRSGGLHLVGFATTMAVAGGLWFCVSMVLPHRDAPRTALLPGALLVGAGTQVMHIVTTIYIADKVKSSSQLYGAMGAAAAVLLWLYLLGAMIVAAAVLNATLWDRRQARDGALPAQQ